MSGMTRRRYEEIHEAAKALVASVGGVETLDAITDMEARRSILIGLAKQLKTSQGIARYETARSHIAKACRRMRDPDNWGGARPNTGPKTKDE